MIYADNESVTMAMFKIRSFFTKATCSLALLLPLLCVSSLSAQDTGEDSMAEVQTSASVDESVPLLLAGIWENYSRYIIFDTGSLSAATRRTVPSVVLRTFYQWYDDRAAESAEYSVTHKRDRNNTTPAQPEQMELHFTPLTDELFTSEYDIVVTQDDGDTLTAENAPSGAWDMEVRFSGKKLGGVDTYHIPIAVIGNKLYLHFAIKIEDSDSVPQSELLNDVTIQAERLVTGFWRDTGSANGIFVSPPVTNTELLSYLATNDAVYHIRYWRTDMDYDADAEAVFTDGDKTYTVPKHLRSAGNTYTCTLGRRSRIRNIDKSKDMPGDYVLNSVLVKKHRSDSAGNAVSYTVRTATICAFGEPYLTLTDGTRTMEEIVAAHNARRHPQPASPFPPHGLLDYDWSVIEDPPASWDRRMLDLGK